VNNQPDAMVIGDDGFGAPVEAQQLARELLPVLYQDVRRLARRERRRVNAGLTLQTTALVHEAYLKLHSAPGYNDRQHFLRAAALAMRHILLNHARDQLAEKRGAGARQVLLEDLTDVGAVEATALIEINEALGRLAKLSPRLAQIVGSLQATRTKRLRRRSGLPTGPCGATGSRHAPGCGASCRQNRNPRAPQDRDR
jgi:RNA polymerase sigma factor (TIGR02999 family)